MRGNRESAQRTHRTTSETMPYGQRTVGTCGVRKGRRGTTGETTCADGQKMCRQPNVGAVSTEASSYRRRSSPLARHGRRHNVLYTDGHPRCKHGRQHNLVEPEGHRRHSANRRHTNWQAGPTVRMSRHRPGCADGIPRHNYGHRHSN
jgi:prepilin-type processing-associated H-X9-DG protein